MTSAFECEVRFFIPEISAFRARLISLGARGFEPYAFTDRYFRPDMGEWDSRTRALRVRDWREPRRPSELLLTYVEAVGAGGLTCKRSLLPQGKLRLHEGSSAECADVCAALGFVPWLEVVKNDCAVCEVPGLGTASYEHVAALGWMSEIEVEGADPAAALARIGAALAALGVPLASATDLPMAVLVAERLRQRPAFPS